MKPIAYVVPIEPIMTHKVLIQDRIEGLNTSPRLYNYYASEGEALEDVNKLVKAGLMDRD